MLGLGVLVFLVWLVLQIFGLALDAAELVLKISLVLIVVGAVVDTLFGFRFYRGFRR